MFIFASVYSFATVQPVGMPLAPSVQPVIDEALVNVPVADTPLSQSVVQSDAEMFVAKHLMLRRLVQP